MRNQFLASLLQTPLLAGVHVSPDTQWVAWSWSNINPTRQVYLAPTDGSQAPQKVTNSNQDVWVTSWSPDSRFLLIEYDHDGDERIQIFRIDIHNLGQLIPLTAEHPPYFIRGGELTPDNRFLVYGANYDFKQKEVIEPTYIYRQNLKTGEKKLLAKPSKPIHSHPLLNDQGTYVLYHRKDLNPAGIQVWVVDLTGENDREILNFGAANKVTASWLPDGRRVVFEQEEQNYKKIGIYALDSGSFEWLLTDPQRNIEEAYVPRGSKEVVIVESKQARATASLIDLNSKKERLMPGLHTSIPLAPLTPTRWLSLHYNATQPNDLVIQETNSASPLYTYSLSRVWDKISYTLNNLTKPESYTWQSTDGLSIQGWLYRTTAPVKGTIVFVHGGPSYHSEDQFNTSIQFFVSQGFNVLDPNYRGSTGFGVAFREVIKKDGWGGREQVDIIEGVKSLIKDTIAEEKKIGITGTSYGGYSAWYAITHFPVTLIKAAVPICGMTDLVVDYYTTRPDLRPLSEEMLRGTPKENPQKYYDASPIHFIQNIQGELLIVQGKQDPNVTLDNVKAVKEKLEKYNIPYDELVFEDEGHGISKRHNQEILLRTLVQFFEQALSSQS